MSSSLLLYLYERKKVNQEVDGTTYDITKTGQDKFSTIARDPVCEGDSMFENECILLYFIVCVLLRRYWGICHIKSQW